MLTIFFNNLIFLSNFGYGLSIQKLAFLAIYHQNTISSNHGHSHLDVLRFSLFIGGRISGHFSRFVGLFKRKVHENVVASKNGDKQFWKWEKQIEKLEKFEYGNIQREWKIQRVENSEKEKIRN